MCGLAQRAALSCAEWLLSLSAVVAGVGLRVDSDSNALLYGGGVAPAAILRGEVAQPANLMAPLLQVWPRAKRAAPWNDMEGSRQARTQRLV